jgi:hypothetical protein
VEPAVTWLRTDWRLVDLIRRMDLEGAAVAGGTLLI